MSTLSASPIENVTFSLDTTRLLNPQTDYISYVIEHIRELKVGESLEVISLKPFAASKTIEDLCSSLVTQVGGKYHSVFLKEKY